MKLLPKGITGFEPSDEGVPVERFTAACHPAVRQVAGRVNQVKAAYEQESPNFHQAFISLRDRPEVVRVLCTAHYPVVAFATLSTFEGDVGLEFMDCPELAEALRGEFTIIPKCEACACVADASMFSDARTLASRCSKVRRSF
jgi:hypothetical protein